MNAEEGYALLAQATGFEWDEGNAPKLRSRHAVDPGEAEQAFFLEPFVVSYDATHSRAERRWRALGQTFSGRKLFLVFTMRGTLIRVIGARDMNRQEREHYVEVERTIEADPGI